MTIDTELTYPHVGLIITTGNPPRRFKITKVNPKSVAMIGEDRVSYKLPTRTGMVRADADQTWEEPTREPLVMGQVVRFVTATAQARFPGLYVVTKPSDGDKVNLVRLGGNPDRPNAYVRAGEEGLELVHGSWVS